MNKKKLEQGLAIILLITGLLNHLREILYLVFYDYVSYPTIIVGLLFYGLFIYLWSKD